MIGLLFSLCIFVPGKISDIIELQVQTARLGTLEFTAGTFCCLQMRRLTIILHLTLLSRVKKLLNSSVQYKQLL
ncbi:hypothetical protein SRHO_G00022970 [Serrasalmus rhombeus]